MGRLIDAINKSDVAEVERLLEKSQYLGGYKNSHLINEETEQIDPMRTPLGLAAKNGSVRIIQALLKAGANVNQSASKYKLMPLCIAAYCGQVNAIKALLEGGANVNQSVDDNKYRQTAIYLAVYSGHVDAITALLEGGADVNKCIDGGWTPLHCAAYKDHADDVFRVLIKAGANIQARTTKGQTPLDIAKEKGHSRAVRILEAYIQQQSKIASLPTPVLLKKPTETPKQTTQSLPATNQQPSTIKPLTEQLGVLKISFTIPYDQLTLGKELGRGGFGMVYQATWQKHVDVAVKQLHVTSFSEETLSEFKHEMEVMAQLRSPNIIQLYGICIAPYCMVMELMAKGSLYHVLHSNTPLPWSQREPIALDMSKGLSYLHNKNILHRDLKSLNVLLDKNMSAKLSDFGLAKIKTESSSQSNNGVAGTLLWMAPELFKRKAQCSKESDVYSLGMTLWELASREIPFKDASNQAIAKQWISEGEREEIPKDTPPQIAKMITVCWDQESSKRPTADQVAEGLKVMDMNSSNQSLASQPQYLDNLTSVNRKPIQQ